jgi:hypothetical protein
MQSKAVRVAIAPRRSSNNPVTAQWLALRARSSHPIDQVSTALRALRVFLAFHCEHDS